MEPAESSINIRTFYLTTFRRIIQHKTDCFCPAFHCLGRKQSVFLPKVGFQKVFTGLIYEFIVELYVFSHIFQGVFFQS